MNNFTVPNEILNSTGGVKRYRNGSCPKCGWSDAGMFGIIIYCLNCELFTTPHNARQDSANEGVKIAEIANRMMADGEPFPEIRDYLFNSHRIYLSEKRLAKFITPEDR